MRIEICNTDGKNMTIPIPEFLANNPLSLQLATSQISQNSPLRVTTGDLKAMLNAIKDYKTQNGGDFLLVEVESSDGERVKIWI